MTQIQTGAGLIGTATGGDKLVPNFWADFLRQNLFPTCHFRQFGTKIVIPRGFGNSVKIPRFKNVFAVSGGSTVLSAGRQPTAIKENFSETAVFTDACAKGLCAESISGNTLQFGGVRGYTQKVIMVSHANIIQAALESLLRELAFRLDRYTRIALTANSTLRHNEISTSVHGASQGLIGQNIARIAPYLGASMAMSWPDGLWPLITNPLSMWDVMTDTSANGFVVVARYNDASMIYRGEVGQMYGVRFVLANNIPVAVGTAATTGTIGLSVASTGVNSYVLGPDAFYALEQAENGLEVIHHPPGSGGATGDALNTYGSVGVKIWYGVVPSPQVDRRIIRYAHEIGLRY